MKFYQFKIEISDEGKVDLSSDGNMDDILITGFLELEKQKHIMRVLARVKDEPTAEILEDE